MSVIPDKKVLEHANYPFDSLDADIARWENFLAQARQEVAALQGSSDPNNRAQAARLNQMIPVAETHLASLLTRKQLAKDDPNNCGLGGLLADWDHLQKLAEQQRQQMAPAAAMAQNVRAAGSGVFNMIGGAAAGSLNAASVSILQRQIESDAEFIDLAQSSMETIRQSCIDQQDDQKLEDFKRKLEAANPVAEQAAKEAEAIAANGRFSDETKITALLTKVLEVSRVNQLMGHEDLGLKQQQAVQHVFKTFITSAAQTCSSQSFSLQKAYGAERTNEFLSVGVDLSPCMNRLFEASGLTNDLLPYRIRHCGPRLDGAWKMQFTHGQIDGAFGKIEGPAVEVPPFGAAMKVATPLGSVPILPISEMYSESGEAQIQASGTVGNAQGRVDDMRISGIIKIGVETETMAPGVVIHMDMKMHADLKQEGFTARSSSRGSAPTHYPGGEGRATDLPISIINGNKPCDPNADIWSYPTN